MPFLFKIATAEVSYLNMESVWNKLISVLQNCFQELMCSGASVLKQIVLISLIISGFTTTFKRLGSLTEDIVSTNLVRSGCFAIEI
jgi:hypothetical protein